jgi:hypothetical protein
VFIVFLPCTIWEKQGGTADGHVATSGICMERDEENEILQFRILILQADV